MTNSDDEQTAPMLPQRPLPIEQLAPSAPRWSHEQALHFSSIAVQPDIYDPNHSALAKLAAAYLELTKQHTKLADRLEALQPDPSDIAILQSTISHRAFHDTYPKTSAAIKRLLDKQVG